MVDLILGRDSELATMPWAHRAPVSRTLRRWEPEPLRWLGYQATSLSQAGQEWCFQRQAPEVLQRMALASGRLLERLRS